MTNDTQTIESTLRNAIRFHATATGLHIEVDPQPEVENPPCGRCGTVFASDDEIFSHDCPPRGGRRLQSTHSTPTIPAVAPASDKQAAFLRRLVSEVCPEEAHRIDDIVAQGKSRVSKAIDALLAKRTTAPVAPAPVVTKRVNRYAGTCGHCGRRVAAEAGTIENKDGKWIVWHNEGDCIVASSFPFPDGCYAVDNAEGTLTFYQVSDGLVYVQASSELHVLHHSAQAAVVTKIAQDPREASARYGRELKHCGLCGRPLTNKDSREIGIGPYCAKKVGW